MTGLGAAGIAAGGVCVGVAAWARAVFAPQSRVMCPLICRGDTSGPPRVALTFDDGPCPGATDAVLRILDEEGVPAAFFVIGANVRRWPEIVRRIDAAGHIVANHTDSHDHMAVMGGTRYWLREIDRADAAVEAAIGRRPAYFRPPMGWKTFHTAIAARRLGHTVVTWSRGARDGLPTTPARIVRRVAPRVRGGDIVLLHDGVEPNRARDPAATIAALRPLIRDARARGVEFTRLDRLIGVAPYAGDGRAGPVRGVAETGAAASAPP